MSVLTKQPISDEMIVPMRRLAQLDHIHLVIDAFQDYAVTVDTVNTKIVWYSSSFMARFSPAEQGVLIGGLLAVLDGLEIHAEAISSEPIKTAAKDKRARTDIRCNDIGEFETIFVPLENEHTVVKFVEISEREQVTQRHLEDREKLLYTSRAISVSEMAATLAHELNQPIGSISNLVKGVRTRLSRERDASDDILKVLDHAVDQAVFSSKIIARIRDYTHSRQPKRDDIDVVNLVRASATLLDWEVRRDNITLRMDFSDAMPMVVGDEIMLQQVFVNLIRNAIDAMRGNSLNTRCLNIHVHCGEGQAEIAISDTGCGLSADDEETLFVPFISNKPTGMGIGLNICRSFIELHQGKLWFTRNEKAGATFHVALPTS